MNKSIVLALATAGTLLCTGAARAANVSWSVGINVPGVVITGGPVYQEPVRVYQPAPVYLSEPVYAPVPVYAPAPVYAPVPVVYEREPVYYPRHPQWRHHYNRPMPAVEVPRYQPGWQPVGHPHYWDGRRDRRDWDDRREQRGWDGRRDRHD